MERATSRACEGLRQTQHGFAFSFEICASDGSTDRMGNRESRFLLLGYRMVSFFFWLGAARRLVIDTVAHAMLRVAVTDESKGYGCDTRT
jgi:hypothetical protein